MNKKQALGKAGEDQIAKVLDFPGCTLFRNLYIPTGKGRATEIDLLLLGKKGIFAIESKNFGGQITGSLRLNDWTRTYKKKGSRSPIRTKFFNPIKQGATHVQTLCRYLRLPQSKAPLNIIVFTSRAELKKTPPNTKDFLVLQGTGALHAAIARRLKARDDIFTDQELATMAIALRKASKASEATKANHIADAKRAQRKRLAEKERRKQARSGAKKKISK